MQNLLTRFRRDLHQIPELDRQVPKTLAYVEAALAPLPCRLFHPIPQALCAFSTGERRIPWASARSWTPCPSPTKI